MIEMRSIPYPPRPEKSMLTRNRYGIRISDGRIRVYNRDTKRVIFSYHESQDSLEQAVKVQEQRNTPRPMPMDHNGQQLFPGDLVRRSGSLARGVITAIERFDDRRNCYMIRINLDGEGKRRRSLFPDTHLLLLEVGSGRSDGAECAN